MVLTTYSFKICQKTCIPLSKIYLLRYSTNVKLTKATTAQIQEPLYITVPKNYPTQLANINLLLTLPSDLNQTTIGKKNVTLHNKSKSPNNEPEWKHIEVDTSKLGKYCLMLSKIRLTSLVVITTMGGYALAPAPFDLYTFVMCTVGTGLVSATANSINQFFEVPFDAQMSRTKNRVLVRGYLTPAHAITFAAISGVTGLSTLYFGVNGITALLGATNLLLYTIIYTPLKRISILNTWVGSIVGAIPPLMGWAGCTGDIAASGAWIMSGLLYAWQFPHFNALSWNLRPDYSRAGYRMMAVTNPDLCRKTALRYTAVLMGLSYLAPILDVTHWSFAVASTPLNAYFLYLAWRFYKESDSANSRKLFRFSLIHLPVLMVFMLITKKHWFTNNKKIESSVQTNNEKKEFFSIFTKQIATSTA